MDTTSDDIRRIEVAPGVRLAVKVGGTPGKPVLVFSNSLAADMGSWDEVAERLAPHARIVRYDARGHGRSDVPGGPVTLADLGRDVLALLDALGIGKAAVCGLSLGGMTGMWLAIHAPQRVTGLALANTAASFPPPTLWRERADAARASGSVAGFVEPTLGRWFTAGFRAAAPDRVAAIGRAIAATPAAGYAAACEVLAETDLLPELGRIACPTLVIAGQHDPSSPPARGEEIVAAVPGATLVTLDAAHLSAVEAPDAFASHVIRFVSGLSST